MGMREFREPDRHHMYLRVQIHKVTRSEKTRLESVSVKDRLGPGNWNISNVALKP